MQASTPALEFHEQGTSCNASPAPEVRAQRVTCGGLLDQSLDFVTGVLGVQVLADSPTIQWTSGHQTVLPYLPKETEHSVRNMLENDRKYIEELAGLLESTPASDSVVFLSKHDSLKQLINKARKALSLGKTVVV